MLTMMFCGLLWVGVQGLPDLKNSTSMEAIPQTKTAVVRQRHISEFTDPETGKNPFLHIAEGNPNDRRRPTAGPPTNQTSPPLVIIGFPVLPVPVEGETGRGRPSQPFGGRRGWQGGKVSEKPEVKSEEKDWPDWTVDMANKKLEAAISETTTRIITTDSPQRQDSSTRRGPVWITESPPVVNEPEDKTPQRPRILYSALLIGAAVLFFAALMGVCIWRSRKKPYIGGSASKAAVAVILKRDRLLKV